MKYFDYLTEAEETQLFLCPPTPFSKNTEPDLLRKAVGGLLYIPGSHTNIAQKLIEGKIRGLVSMAICLEDAVSDRDRAAAEENVRHQLDLLCQALRSGQLSPARLPLLFVRVKDNEMLARMSDCFVAVGSVLTGVIQPKTACDTLEDALVLTDQIAAQSMEPFYLMPILESEELMLTEGRIAQLRHLMSLMDAHPNRVLNVRVGATDLCGLYGIRRQMDTPIYSIPLVVGCIADVVRVFGLGDRYTVSGPVWEYYRQWVSGTIMSPELTGLLREVYLDIQNGIWGKTCVHPTQLAAIQTAYALPYEAYQDALALTTAETKGVLPSAARNKMNERNPHALWAKKRLQQAKLYGVLREHIDGTVLLSVAQKAEVALWT